MPSVKRRYSKEEFARRGDALYEKEVRPQLKAGDDGKFAAIDIESGEFAIDADELKACHKLRKRIPNAQIWMVRIGYRSVHRIGGMSFMFEVYYKPPANPAKETAVTDRVATFGGRLDFREEGEEHGLGGVCLTYEFDDLESATKAAEALRQLGEHVEGPMDYGP